MSAKQGAHLSGIDIAKLEKAITGAFLPFLNHEINQEFFLSGALSYQLDQMRKQIELFQSLASTKPPCEEVEVTAGALSGFSEGLINQVSALEALNDCFYDQLRHVQDERDQALEALAIANKHKDGE